MLKRLTEETCQGNWSIIRWVSFIPFFEDRGYVCLFPDGWEFTCAKFFFYTLVAGWGQVLYEGPAGLWA